jgi:hypothetical protein
LEDENDKSLLKLRQDGFANKEAQEHGITGWDMVLNNLKQLLEAE